MKKSDQLTNPTLTLLLSGILIYEGSEYLEAILTRVIFLLAPSRLTFPIYFSYIYNALIFLGIIWLITLILKNKQIKLITDLKPEILKNLGISFLVILVASTLLNFFSSDYFAKAIVEYVESENLGPGYVFHFEEVVSPILIFLKGGLFMVLFFVSLKRSKNEQII
ncbi:MAG: hypothetical protein Roseis2KO_40510 [Roseivirga sp.]